MCRLMDLPFELRIKIWKLCLPDKVFELDLPWDEAIVGGRPTDLHDPGYCIFHSTGVENARPPLIARVCQEARAVVVGSLSPPMVPDIDQQLGPCYATPEVLQEAPLLSMVNLDRCSPHLYYEEGYDFCNLPDDCSPLDLLARAAEATKRSSASLMVGYLKRMMRFQLPEDILEHEAQLTPIAWPAAPPAEGHDSDSDSEAEEERKFYHDTIALKRLSAWQVVMNVIIIHLDAQQARESGCFGLLGDAPIQIVNFDDRTRFSCFARLAKIGEHNLRPVKRQDMAPLDFTPDLIRRHLLYILRFRGFPSDLYSRLQPAIMFRLCIARCGAGD